METKLYVCFCSEEFEKGQNYASHAGRCKIYQENKKKLELKVRELEIEGLSRKKIAETLTASLDPSLLSSGVTVSLNFVKDCLRKPKQKELKATLAAEATEANLTLLNKLMEAGFFDEPTASFIGNFADRIISLKKQIQDLNESTKVEKIALCGKIKDLSRDTGVLISLLNTQKKEENAALIERCRSAMVISGEDSLVERK